ncbi:MAG: efflux RND transporter periplasmic adaptor subunit [Bacteroidetes bacterium]|nr:MAG: efflux RND transporter periplasmic adaptor subunit [Bacteroidota bacterium]
MTFTNTEHTQTDIKDTIMKRFIIISGMLVTAGITALLLLTGTSTTTAQPASGNAISTSSSVSVVTAKKQSLSEQLSLVGTIAANNDVVVLSETQGRVTKVFAEVGDQLKAGEVIAEVDSEMKEAAYKAASMTYEKAKKDLERFEALYKEGSIPESQIEQARWNHQNAESQFIVARRQFRDTRVTTPIAGILTARPVNVGTMLQGAPQPTVVANVVDIAKLKVKLNVAEKDIFKLKVGDAVTVTTDVYPGQTFEGRIATVSVKGDDAHTYPVEIAMANSAKTPLKAGMFATVSFRTGGGAASIVIPREAVVGSLKSAKVYVVESGRAKLRAVTAGAETGTSVEILSGLREGETVVVNGQNNLKDNAAVTVRN